jgi:hypothetical protein
MSLLPWWSSKHYILWMCVCSLSYPSCKARVRCYIVLYGFSDCITFPHYLTNGTIFGKEILNTNCVLWFSLQLLIALSVYRLRYRLDGPGMGSRWVRGRFSATSRPALDSTQPMHWVLCHSLGKRIGAWLWPPTPSSTKVKVRVHLYLYSPSEPS